jgi:hypothetical protein
MRHFRPKVNNSDADIVTQNMIEHVMLENAEN